MKKGLAVVGVVVIVLGLLMTLMFWPMMGTMTEDEFEDKDAEWLEDNKDEEVKVIFELNETEWDDMETFEEEAENFTANFNRTEWLDLGFNDTEIDEMLADMDYEIPEEIDGPGEYLLTGNVTNMNSYDIDEVTIEKIPTMMGMVGLLITIVGVILLVAGAAMGGKKTEEAPVDEPTEEAPVEEAPVEAPVEEAPVEAPVEEPTPAPAPEPTPAPAPVPEPVPEPVAEPEVPPTE